ncbi:MAG: DNA topoisomerase IV [Flavobacteriales bacterium]|nr:DNA topoisomerase IV [Flavobacteriales bacterium]|tara:strand:+ start:17207 stop:19054 length:1848 start_codon:yes stop_codon:yes gene_type:complete
MSQNNYTEENIKSLDWKEHIRMRPGMYIGKKGDGSSTDDGIYVLLKEIMDNCMDEFVMGYGKTIDLSVKNQKVIIRDYGRGIPLGKVVDCVSKINTGGKYDTKAFKKAVGLNGVGTKAVNALSEYFKVQSIRDGKTKIVEFNRGSIILDDEIKDSSQRNGTRIMFVPDSEIFSNFKFLDHHISTMIWNYVYLNPGLTIIYNNQKFFSENGLKDLLTSKLETSITYPIIHLMGDDIEVALSHSKSKYGETYFSFVNGQHTTQGGTHQVAFREAIAKTFKEFFNKNFEASDIRQSIVAAVSIKVMEPVFESQTKTKLGSTEMGDSLPTIRTYINEFVKRKLDNFLHKNPEISDIILKKIQQAEKERKDLVGIKKLSRERAKKSSLHNKKLRDCKVHYNDLKKERRLETTLFITEGDSASGSITKARDVYTQAVFSLKGKPLNCYGLTKKVVYENEEFNLLQSALNIENEIENLRYNNIVIATDADVDGMHIRLLIITFFLQFFPDLVKEGHLYILQTPLFRVRNKKETIYCYDNNQKLEAEKKLTGKLEITRFKGLGEISPHEFKNFIGSDIKLDPVLLKNDSEIEALLTFYMGKNTQDRQNFIIDNLRMEKDIIDN